MKTLAADALKQIRIAPRRPNSARKVPPIFPSIDRPEDRSSALQIATEIVCRSPKNMCCEKVIDSGKLNGDIHHAAKEPMKVLSDDFWELGLLQNMRVRSWFPSFP